MTACQENLFDCYSASPAGLLYFTSDVQPRDQVGAAVHCTASRATGRIASTVRRMGGR